MVTEIVQVAPPPDKHESTDHFEGIAPGPFRVRPEPRRPGWNYRSLILAACRQCLTGGAPGLAGKMAPKVLSI